LEGGEARTAFKTSEIWSFTSMDSSSTGRANISERIEYDDSDRYGFPRRGRVRRRFVIAGRD
jgi:hypothetical protein